jgi:hypothetical protein
MNSEEVGFRMLSILDEESVASTASGCSGFPFDVGSGSGASGSMPTVPPMSATASWRTMSSLLERGVSPVTSKPMGGHQSRLGSGLAAAPRRGVRLAAAFGHEQISSGSVEKADASACDIPVEVAVLAIGPPPGATLAYGVEFPRPWRYIRGRLPWRAARKRTSCGDATRAVVRPAGREQSPKRDARGRRGRVTANADLLL